MQFLILLFVSVVFGQKLSFGAIRERILKGYDASTRPSVGGPPVQISSQFRINHLSNINPMKDSFELDLFLRLKWTDPRLAYPEVLGKDLFRIDPKLLWTPDIYFYNEQEKMTVLDATCKINNDGGVFYSAHFIMSFQTHFDLHEFPFDSQTLPVRLVSYSHSEDEMILKWYDAADGGPTFPALSETFSAVLWDLQSVESSTTDIVFKENTTAYAFNTLEITVKRDWTTYVLKYVAPLFFICLCSSLSYWVDPKVVPARVGFGVSLLLSSVTLNFVVSAELPKINYPTLLDTYIAVVFSFVFLSLLEFAIVHHLHLINRPKLATHIEYVSRTLPILMILITISIFTVVRRTIGSYIVWGLICLYALVILGYSLVIGFRIGKEERLLVDKV
ncbi:neurotransmitter-gated ion-channel ligand-binding domain-containing protein [Globomyces pollinis-pini]|nr:neurotransmitter-gated ion-channel ligand-binding domain-containing protein [Globomyces pollinis-pini]